MGTEMDGNWAKMGTETWTEIGPKWDRPGAWPGQAPGQARRLAGHAWAYASACLRQDLQEAAGSCRDPRGMRTAYA